MPTATTLGTYIGIAATIDLSEDAVYELTRAYWESVKRLGETSAPAKGMNAKISVENTATLLHAGARLLSRDRHRSTGRAGTTRSVVSASYLEQNTAGASGVLFQGSSLSRPFQAKQVA